MQLYSFEKWKAFSLLNLKPSNLEKYSKLLSNYFSPVCDTSPRVKVRGRHTAFPARHPLQKDVVQLHLSPPTWEQLWWLPTHLLLMNLPTETEGKLLLKSGLWTESFKSWIIFYLCGSTNSHMGNGPIFILLPLPKQKRHSKHYKYSLLYIKYTFTPSSGIMEILKADWSSLYLAKCYHH